MIYRKLNLISYSGSIGCKITNKKILKKFNDIRYSKTILSMIDKI
jgi:hypothetical protein